MKANQKIKSGVFADLFCDDEKDGKKLELSRGIRWVDNDMVNLLSNVFSSVFALGMGVLVAGL